MTYYAQSLLGTESPTFGTIGSGDLTNVTYTYGTATTSINDFYNYS